jgi:hypothetical protein
MIKAMIFNWSGTLSDYGGRGRTTWYQAVGGETATATQLAKQWIRPWPNWPFTTALKC